MPNLEFIASCDYNDKFMPLLEAESSNCQAFLSSAHLTGLDELESDDKLASNSLTPPKLQDLPGSNPYCPELSRTGQRALLRCGNVHFDLGDGVFIVFWKALAVLSIPEEKVLLSIPLHWSDSESSGLFADINGAPYLIARHGFDLQTYRLP